MIDTAESHTVWVCVDCYEEHHGIREHVNANDRTPEPLRLIDEASEVTAGMLWEEHESGCNSRIAHELGDTFADASECGCERQDFSWSPCEGCGSHLGGAREALTVWPAR